jgi:hypothetical protein
MDRDYLLPGDIMRLRSMTHYHPPVAYNAQRKPVGILSSGYTAPKGKVFVMVILGVESKEPKTEEETIDVEAAMDLLGWIRKPMPEK